MENDYGLNVLLKTQCFIFVSIAIQTTTSAIARTPFATEEKIESRLPNPVMEIGTSKVTTIPPPIKIKIHIPKRKPYNIFKISLPSAAQ